MTSWIVEPSEEVSANGVRRVAVQLGWPGFLTSLFYSRAGNVYVTDFHGRLLVHHHVTNAPFRRWTRFDFGEDVQLNHVFGLDDETVFVLGRDVSRRRMWRLGADGPVPMAPPPGRATVLRGLAPDLLYAGGDRGLLAEWNGRRWRRIVLPLRRNVTGLSVAAPDELWLTTDSGKLFEGTSHGWGLRARFDGPLYDVASWRGDVFVAAGPRGLLRLVPKTNILRVANASIEPITLDGRGDLTALSNGYLATSSDARAFRLSCRGVLRGVKRQEPPRWRARSVER